MLPLEMMKKNKQSDSISLCKKKKDRLSVFQIASHLHSRRSESVKDLLLMRW